MRTVDAAVFDFGGVLTEPIFRRSRPDDPGAPFAGFFALEAVSVYAEPTGHHDLHRLEVGSLGEAEFIDRLVNRYVAAGNTPLDRVTARRYLFGRGIVACAAMVDTVREVHAAGYRTALLTNNVREWEADWRAVVPVDELFDVVVDSSRVGLRKPDPAIYRLCCERLGVALERCLFVDDMHCNVTVAQTLGMSVIHCTDPVAAAVEVRERLSVGVEEAAT